MASGTKTQKPKLTDGAVLWFKEKCPCGTEIEFEASTGMVFDKMMVRWDKAHQAHIEDAAYPPVYAPDMDPLLTKLVKETALKVEKTMLLGDVKKKKPSAVEMEETSREAWAKKDKHEKERVRILQRQATGELTQDDTKHLLEEVDRYERREQKQSQGDQGAAETAGDATSSRVRRKGMG